MFTISLGRILAITMVMTILVIGVILAMDMHTGLQEIGQQYSTAS